MFWTELVSWVGNVILKWLKVYREITNVTITQSNGFVIAKKWKNSIHKYLKVSDRICVFKLQLKVSSEVKDGLYQSQPISDTPIKISKLTTKKWTFEKVNPKARHIINIINLYAPTSKRVKQFPDEIQNMYNDHNKLCKEMDITMSTLIAGDFNTKIGKKNRSENLTGQSSRRRRNDSASKLA